MVGWTGEGVDTRKGSQQSGKRRVASPDAGPGQKQVRGHLKKQQLFSFLFFDMDKLFLKEKTFSCFFAKNLKGGGDSGCKTRKNE